MGRIDEQAYNMSQVDWARLKGFARRVAAAGVAAGESGPWLLDSRDWDSSESRGGWARESWERHRFLLMPDGRMVHEVNGHAKETGPEPDENFSRSQEFDETDVVLFDYNRQERTSGRGDRQVRSTRDRGDRLTRHAKGVGLSIMLRDLKATFEGQAARR